MGKAREGRKGERSSMAAYYLHDRSRARALEGQCYILLVGRDDQEDVTVLPT